VKSVIWNTINLPSINKVYKFIRMACRDLSPAINKKWITFFIEHRVMKCDSSAGLFYDAHLPKHMTPVLVTDQQGTLTPTRHLIPTPVTGQQGMLTPIDPWTGLLKTLVKLNKWLNPLSNG
jgi:hypothetical protein